jgi:hypothetical protein
VEVTLIDKPKDCFLVLVLPLEVVEVVPEELEESDELEELV